MPALLRSAGEPALRRALPLYAGIGIAAAVLFGPGAMRAADVTDAAAASRPFRLGLWAAWLAGIVGPARVLLGAPAGLYLRSLAAPPALHQGILASALAALELPWAWLWLCGAGALAAAAALALGVALAALLATRARGHAERAFGVALAAGGIAIVALPAPAWVALAAGLTGTAILVPAAWWRAPEAGPGWCVVRVRGAALSALVLAHAAWLWRRRRPALSRALIATAVGIGFAIAAARANGIAGGAALAALSLAVASVTLAAVACAFAVSAVESERSMRWILDSAGASGPRRTLAAAAAAAGLAAALGALHGGLVACGAGAGAISALRLGAGGAAWGGALGLIALRLARAAERPAGVEGARVVAYASLVAIACAVAAGVAGEVSLAAVGAIAAAVTIRSVDRAAFPARCWARHLRVGE